MLITLGTPSPIILMVLYLYIYIYIYINVFDEMEINLTIQHPKNPGLCQINLTKSTSRMV